MPRSDSFKHQKTGAEGKRSQTSVNYSKGNPAEHCGICRHFLLPNACELIEGHIVPSYWCRLFAKAKMTTGKHIRKK